MSNLPNGVTVDPGHAQAPAHFWPMTEGAGQPGDIGTSGLPAPTGDTPTWTTEVGAAVSVWDGTKHCDYGTGSLLAGKSKFTIVLSVKPANITQTGGWLAKREAYQNKSALFVGMVTGTGFGDIVLFQVGNEVDSTLTYGWNPWGGSVPSVQVQLIFSYDGSLSAGNRVKLYKNGVPFTTGINSGSPVLGDAADLPVPSTLAPVWIGQGGGFGGANGEYNGTISYLYAIEDVAVSSGEAATLFTTPFPFAITSPLLTAITVSGLSDTTATITWTTEVAATSRVEYGIGNFDTVEEVLTLVTSHSIPLTGLTPDSAYQYRVLSTASGTTATSGAHAFDTEETPAVIGPLLIDMVSANKMRVSITTDVDTTAVLEYGTTTGYGADEDDAVLSTLHRFSLSGLVASTTYHFRVTVARVGLTETQSADYVYATTANDAVVPPAIADLVADLRVAQNGVRLRWTAPGDDPGLGRTESYIVRYSTSVITSGNFASASTFTQSLVPKMAGSIEELIVTGLSANTTYYFAVKSIDPEGNVSAISNVPSVTTLAGRAALDIWGGDTRIASPSGINVGCTVTGRVSTGLTGTVLTDSGASFPTDGRLVGKVLCPDITFVANSRMLWFVIVSNTATTITVDSMDGPMTDHAASGDTYMVTGVFATELIGDQWWFIDPEGYAFFPRGTALTVNKYGGGFYSAHPHHAVWLKRTAGLTTANLAKQGATRALNPATAAGDVINASGVTVHLVGDEIIIGDSRPFGDTYFQLNQVGVGGQIQWSYSTTGSTWTLLGSGTGKPEAIIKLGVAVDVNLGAATLTNTYWSLDIADTGGGPQAGGGYDNGIHVRWFSAANYPAPTDWVPTIYPSTDGETRYYIKGVVTVQFTTDPIVSACFEHSTGRTLLALKYHGSSTTVAQDYRDRYLEIGMNAAGYAASYLDYAADALMPRSLASVGGTGVTYYAHRDVNGVYGPLTPKGIYEAVPNSGSSDINYTYFTSTAISAQASDNSLNLASGSFPNWEPDYGIVLRGFATASNNKGRVVVSRTATKIVVSGGDALVDAAAGPEITLSLIFGGGRHQVDPWDIYLPDGAAAVVAELAMRADPNVLYLTPDEPDFVFGFSGWRGRTHIGYCLITSNPSRLYSQHGTDVTDYRFFGKYAMRDFLRYRYKDPGETLTPLTRSSQTPIYSYTAGAPSGDELTALENLNDAWGTAYTTWDTESGDIEDFTNQWGTGSGWMDEDGRNILQPGLYPPDATGGANSEVSYLDLESNLLMPAIWTDIEDFVALTADRYAFVVYDAIRARTPNMITNFLYETWPTMAAVLIAQVDLQWIATGFAQVRPTSEGTVPPTAPEPEHTIAQYAIHHKPMWFEVYTTCNADSPQNFGGEVTAVSYNSGTNLTAITWALGQPLMVHPHVDRFVHLVEVDEWAKIFDWNGLTMYCRHIFGEGDITAMAPVGSHLEYNDAQAFTLAVPISPSTKEGLLEADRDEIIVPALSARMPDGVYPTIGFEKWGDSDDPQEYAIENSSWSFRTSKFNPYNGTDAAIAASRDANGVWIGGEDQDYGDYVTGMKAMWFAAEDMLALRTTAPITPSFLSDDTDTWTPDVLTAFHIVVAGAPAPAITLLSGTLPTGVAILDNGDGSAILGGSTTDTGPFVFTLRAENSFGFVDQEFTLSMGESVGTGGGYRSIFGFWFGGMAGLPAIEVEFHVWFADGANDLLGTGNPL